MARRIFTIAAGLACLVPISAEAQINLANEADLVPIALIEKGTSITSAAAVEPANSSKLNTPAITVPESWGYLYLRLVNAGANPEIAARVLSDPRMPAREELLFSLAPKESKALYRKHNTKKNRRNALAFYQTHAAEFAEAEKKFGVPREVILAILQVETNCGTVTGRSRIFPALARLASAATPENVEANYTAHAARNSKTLRNKIDHRAIWLEQTFLPHAAAVLKLAQERNLDPLEIRGSASGAVGIPQFLPGHLSTFGADGDGDRIVNPFSPKDAIHSVGRFLKLHGWKSLKLADKQKRSVVWNYNRSVAYVDTILAMSKELRKGIAVPKAK